MNKTPPRKTCQLMKRVYRPKGETEKRKQRKRLWSELAHDDNLHIHNVHAENEKGQTF